MYVYMFVGLWCKIVFLDQKSSQATVVKLHWQIKAQINLKKKKKKERNEKQLLFHASWLSQRAWLLPQRTLSFPIESGDLLSGGCMAAGEWTEWPVAHFSIPEPLWAVIYQLPAAMHPGVAVGVTSAGMGMGPGLQLMVFLSGTSHPSSTLIMATVTSSTGAWQRRPSLQPTRELSLVSLSWSQSHEVLNPIMWGWKTKWPSARWCSGKESTCPVQEM